MRFWSHKNKLISPSWVRYGVYVVMNLKIIDGVIMASHCIEWQDHLSPWTQWKQPLVMVSLSTMLPWATWMTAKHWVSITSFFGYWSFLIYLLPVLNKSRNLNNWRETTIDSWVIGIQSFLIRLSDTQVFTVNLLDRMSSYCCLGYRQSCVILHIGHLIELTAIWQWISFPTINLCIHDVISSSLHAMWIIITWMHVFLGNEIDFLWQQTSIKWPWVLF